jgi:hypothetical protein
MILQPPLPGLSENEPGVPTMRQKHRAQQPRSNEDKRPCSLVNTDVAGEVAAFVLCGLLHFPGSTDTVSCPLTE